MYNDIPFENLGYCKVENIAELSFFEFKTHKQWSNFFKEKLQFREDDIPEVNFNRSKVIAVTCPIKEGYSDLLIHKIQQVSHTTLSLKVMQKPHSIASYYKMLENNDSFVNLYALQFFLLISKETISTKLTLEYNDAIAYTIGENKDSLRKQIIANLKKKTLEGSNPEIKQAALEEINLLVNDTETQLDAKFDKERGKDLKEIDSNFILEFFHFIIREVFVSLKL